jgi:hypothetical protein
MPCPMRTRGGFPAAREPVRAAPGEAADARHEPPPPRLSSCPTSSARCSGSSTAPEIAAR